MKAHRPSAVLPKTAHKPTVKVGLGRKGLAEIPDRRAATLRVGTLFVGSKSGQIGTKRFHASILPNGNRKSIPFGHVPEGNGYSARMATDDEIVAARRARLSAWIADHYEGVQAAFIRDTGINQGELSALLATKPFGEKKARKLETQARMPEGYLERPLDLQRPSRVEEPRSIFTKERRASDDVLAVQIALESFVAALLPRVPGAASAFLEDARRVAKDRHFSPEQGFLGGLVEIAAEVQNAEEEAARALRRAGSVRRTKRGK